MVKLMHTMIYFLLLTILFMAFYGIFVKKLGMEFTPDVQTRANETATEEVRAYLRETQEETVDETPPTSPNEVYAYPDKNGGIVVTNPGAQRQALPSMQLEESSRSEVVIQSYQ